MSLLVLDLDGTLTKSDNLVGFSFFMMRRKLKFWVAIPLLILLKFKIINNVTFKKWYAGLILRSLKVEDITTYAKLFANNEQFKEKLNDDVLKFISRFEPADKMILSANFDFLAETIGQQLGISNIKAITLEIKNQRFTGAIIDTIPYGENKVKVFMEYISVKKFDKTIGFGDSPTDKPLLKTLTKGFMVSFNKRQNTTSINQIL